jgi:Outer membrane protein beta-barrel domain
MTPVSNNNDQQPKANLEELFRQKFAEAELTPRADVWDRLDHELLLRENQGYRRRLVGYRRLAAAACALVTLGAGGWLVQHVSGPSAGTEIAAVDSSAAARSAATRLEAAAAQTPLTEAGRTASRNGANGAAAEGAEATNANTATRRAAGATVAAASATSAPATGVDAVLNQLRDSFGSAPGSRLAQPAGSLASRALAAIKQTFGSQSASTTSATAGNLTPGSRLRPGATDAVDGLASMAAGAEQNTAALTAAMPWSADALQPVTARLRRGARPDSLKASLLSAPVLAAQPTDEEKEDKKNASISRWRWRGGYSAERFVPNMSSVTGSGVALRGIPSMNSSLAGRVAPDQTKLQPGLAQRGHFGASVPLGKKHWTLLTGAELTSVSGNTDREMVKEFNSNTADFQPQTGRYHLTTVGVPVQVRYEGRRQGWGVYAAVGAAVNVLLRNRTAVGTMSSTDDASYRRILASARGSAGVRYSPAGGQWQLNVGPEAEAGLTTLNANPTESWAQRTRPYAVGLSASVEFGGGKAELAP